MPKKLSELKAGDEVAIIPGYSRELKYTFHDYRVKKVTPSGQVVVSFKDYRGEAGEKRFDSDGYEMGSSASKYHRDRIEADVEMAREHMAYKQRQQNAAVALAACKEFEVRVTYTKESLQGIVAELEAKLATAKALVEAI